MWPQHKMSPQQQDNQFSQPRHNKRLKVEQGILDLRVNQCIHDRRYKPADNNIEFWKKFVAEYFTPDAKNIWCLSSYDCREDPRDIFYQDVWNCSICRKKHGRGFELPYKLMPRLLQMVYESGTLEEQLSTDFPDEFPSNSGKVALKYNRAVHVSVFDKLRVSREGQLRVVFNEDRKISSWEFCVRSHEELIPRNLISPEIIRLADSVGFYRAKSSSSAPSTQDLQHFCKSFQECSFCLYKTSAVSLVLGFPKKFVRCLQTADVINTMTDLIDYSINTGTGPMESFTNSIRGNSSSVGLIGEQLQQPCRHHNVSSTAAANNQMLYSSKMGVQIGEPIRKDVIAPGNTAIFAGQELNAGGQSTYRTLLPPKMSHPSSSVEFPRVTNEMAYSINRGNPHLNAGISNNMDTSSMAFYDRDNRFGHVALAAALPTNPNYMEDLTISQQEQNFVDQFLNNEV